MGTFNTSKILYASPAVIPTIADNIVSQFRVEGYEVKSERLISGAYDISITKGGAFKAILGMKTALKVNIAPTGENMIKIEAGVGIFGQQAIPTAISMLFLWPVLLTQIWGMVNQAKLDDKAISIAESTVVGAQYSRAATPPPYQPVNAGVRYCTSCGAKVEATAKFCGECGAKL